MTTKRHYTTQLQAGLGLLQETRLLLRIWDAWHDQPGPLPGRLAFR